MRQAEAFMPGATGLDLPRKKRLPCRPELQQIADLVATERSSATVLLGLPGSGKSALLARLGKSLQERGLAVLAIKADRLPNTLDTPLKLAEALDLPVTPDSRVR